jgi:hypothetical protein
MTLILNGTDNSATTPAVTGTDTDTGVYYPAANQVALATAGTQAMLANASQGVQFANAIGVGATTPTTSGAGITFPATQSASSDANTLDDYEEGTFTPTVFFGGSQMSGGALVTQATYTKIGRAVYYLVDVTISTLGTGSGSMQIRGMPFQVTSGTNAYACPAGHSEGLQSAISNFLPLLPPGTTYFDMYYNWNGTGGPTVFAYSNCKNGSGFRLTGLYFTS